MCSINLFVHSFCYRGQARGSWVLQYVSTLSNFFLSKHVFIRETNGWNTIGFDPIQNRRSGSSFSPLGRRPEPEMSMKEKNLRLLHGGHSDYIAKLYGVMPVVESAQSNVSSFVFELCQCPVSIIPLFSADSQVLKESVA